MFVKIKSNEKVRDDFKPRKFSFELSTNNIGSREVIKEIYKFLESMHGWAYDNIRAEILGDKY